MKRWLKRLIILPIQIIAGLLSLILVIGIYGSMLWINADNGTQWVENRIRSQLSGTPYDIELDNLRMRGFSNLSAHSMTVSYNNEIIAQGDDITVSIDLVSLMTQTLEIDLSAKSIEIKSLPPTQTQERVDEGEPMTFPMLLPDLYFNHLSLFTNVKELTLSETIAGEPFSTHFRSTHDIVKQGDAGIIMRGESSLSDTQFIRSEVTPQNIHYEANLNLETGVVTIASLTMVNSAYDITTTGHYDLSRNYYEFHGDATVIPSIENRKDYMPDPAVFTMDIQGEGKTITGQMKTTAKIMGDDVLFKSPLTYNDDVLSFTDLAGYIGNATLSGQIAVNTQDGFVNGTIKAILNNLDMVKYFDEDFSMDGHGTMRVNLSPVDGIQTLQAQVNLTDVATQDIKGQSVDVSLKMPDINMIKNATLTLQGRELELGSYKIASTSATVKPDNNNGLVMNFIATGAAPTPFNLDGDIHLVDMALPAIRLETLRLSVGQSVLKASGDIRPELAEIHATLTTTRNDLGATTVTANLMHLDNLLKVVLDGKGDDISALNGQISAPMSYSLKPPSFDLSPQAALDGFIKADFDIGGLTQPFLDDSGIEFLGQLKADVLIDGSFDSPAFSGFLSLENGEFFDQNSDMRLTQIKGRADFKGTNLMIDTLTASDGSGGTLKSSGQIDLSDMDNPDATIDITANSMTIQIEQIIHADLNAKLSLRTRENYYLSGSITPTEVNIILPNRFNESITQLNIVEANTEKQENFTKNIRLDIDFKAPNRIFVRGRGLDTELGGDLSIGGTVDNPDIQGKLSSVRGRYEQFGRQFNITRSDLRFQGDIPPSPYLNIVASTDANNVTANIHITGPVNQPELSLSSVPSLPQDEILSFILFGKNSTQITPFQAVQLAQSVREFAGMSSGPDFDPIGTLRSITGFDDIAIEGIGTEGARIGAGKYITDKVYLELEQGIGGDSGAASVEVEMTPNITIESKAGQNGSVGGSAFWEWDY